MEKIYGIRITETSSRILAVKANSLDEAFEIIEDAYHNEEIVLDVLKGFKNIDLGSVTSIVKKLL